MERAKEAEPKRRPHDKAGLSGEQENALLAIEMAMSEMKAHGDGLRQWRLAQIERAIDALDHGRHRTALEFVARARRPADRISAAERAEADKLQRQFDVEQLIGRIRARLRTR
jgi:hypothetical protein